jgi:acyl-CoA thioester hydrolase
MFSWPVRVYYEDTDAMGVVYHANYLKFFERARTEWLRARGFQQSRLAADTGALFTVRRLIVEFLSPARYDDLLEARVALTGHRRVGLTLAQSLHRHGVAIEIARATVEIVCVDAATMRPRRIPDPLLAELSDAH